MVVPNSSKREQTLRLIDQKDEIERKISEFGRVLQANNCGMTGNLVDAEDYPRIDIDVHQVRQARVQIMCLQNDLKELMKQIEKGLEEVHAEAALQNINYSSKVARMDFTNDDDGSTAENVTEKKPFTKVNFVSPNSPAEDAGLKVDDEIIEFGSVNYSNFKNLTTIADVVKRREKQRIVLKVKRGAQELEMFLIPQPWAGRGLLGCNIILADSVER